jgi:hypothetical protein
MLSNVCVNILDWLDGTDRAPVSAKARFAERSLNLSLVSTHSREDSIAEGGRGGEVRFYVTIRRLV